MEPHGSSRWRHGCSRITPVSPRRRPGGDTVAPGVFPVYHGICQPSRLLPVVLNILKQPGTWAGLTRFNTVHPGSPRLSTVRSRLWHGSSRIIKPGWTGTLNRDSENGALAIVLYGWAYLSIYLYILSDPLSSIIGRCTLYTPGCRMKAYK